MFGLSTNFIQSQVVLPVSYTISHLSSIRGGSKVNALKNVSTNSQHSHVKSISGLHNSQYDKIYEIKKALCIEEKNCAIVAKSLTAPAYLPLQQPKLNYMRNSFLCNTHSTSWYQSHSSYHTFTENKNGYPADYQDALLKKLLSNRNVVQSLLYGNLRHFKSQQSIERESQKQHSFANIFKQGTSKIKEKSLDLDKDSKHKLNALLAEESEATQKNLKLAFAEGYLAGEPQSKQTTVRHRLVQGIRILASIFTLLLLFPLYLLLKNSGALKFHVVESEVVPEEITVTFEDVKGVEEAKEELQEIVEFLKNPEKFTTLGAELPKGALLVGPPGTGKTLLARAVAGEASVPFFQASGSQFDEVLVGQGARRVRDLFQAAKARAPCVVFIDEIDSVGGKRTANVMHPYANQTINQLLSEMDGFHKNEGVIVLGATNRREDLDNALLRPGRFDVEVMVSVPDLAGRKEIFDYYLSKIKISPEVDGSLMARGTTGFTGADIKNIVNQAALRAASEQVDFVTTKHLEEARDKVLMGPEKKSKIPDEEANIVTAYHEGGHTIVSYYTKHADPLHKVTIIPRGLSLGHTAYIPAKDQYLPSKVKMLAKMDSLMGGRAAEEIVFGSDSVTSGAANDLKVATSMATRMVKEFGMSDKVGFRTFEESTVANIADPLSHSTKEAIDGEIKKLLSDSYERAKAILKTHAKEHKALAEALLKYETLDADDVKAILDGKSFNKGL